jgi:formiminotetrahydrofolate cyclodeaminase
MGCEMSVGKSRREQRDAEVEEQLRKDNVEQRNEIKVLLLGKAYESKTCDRQP